MTESGERLSYKRKEGAKKEEAADLRKDSKDAKMYETTYTGILYCGAYASSPLTLFHSLHTHAQTQKNKTNLRLFHYTGEIRDMVMVCVPLRPGLHS